MLLGPGWVEAEVRRVTGWARELSEGSQMSEYRTF